MNKKSSIIVAILVALALVGGGVYALNSNQNKKESDKLAIQSESSTETDTTTVTDGDAMSKHGSYVTLADYNADQSKYADSKKVYFFHASWCPICRGIDKEINSDMSTIPTGVTLIKTDFDTETMLRQKYGVTTQYTFVQVDDNGNQTAKWSATNLDKVIAGIKT